MQPGNRITGKTGKEKIGEKRGVGGGGGRERDAGIRRGARGEASERAKDTSGEFLTAICRTPRHVEPFRCVSACCNAELWSGLELGVVSRGKGWPGVGGGGGGGVKRDSDSEPPKTKWTGSLCKTQSSKLPALWLAFCLSVISGRPPSHHGRQQH